MLSVTVTNTVASAGDAKTITLWNVNQQKLRLRIGTHEALERVHIKD